MKKLVTVLLLSGLLAPMAHAESEREILCTGDTNYGDVVRMSLRLIGDCEGNFGTTDYCHAVVTLLEEAYTYPQGASSSLMMTTPEKRMIFENRLMPQFLLKGAAIDLMSQGTLKSVRQFDFNMSFAGSRTWGRGTCKVVR